MQRHVEMLEQLFPEGRVRILAQSVRINLQTINTNQLAHINRLISDNNCNVQDVEIKRSGTGLVVLLTPTNEPQQDKTYGLVFGSKVELVSRVETLLGIITLVKPSGRAIVSLANGQAREVYLPKLFENAEKKHLMNHEVFIRVVPVGE